MIGCDHWGVMKVLFASGLHLNAACKSGPAAGTLPPRSDWKKRRPMDSDSREMFTELNALLTAIAKALDLEPEAAARAIEAGEIGIKMEVDEEGRHFVGVDYAGKTSRVYPGVIHHAAEEPAEDDDCGHEGCGCGH